MKNEVAHGKHELENGDVYEGEMYTVTKKPHGAGTMHYKNGDSYQGRYVKKALPTKRQHTTVAALFLELEALCWTKNSFCSFC